MATVLTTTEHVIKGQHIREYPNATKHRQEDTLHLSIKQYVPLDLPDPVPENALTVIGVHGNGFPKASCNLCSRDNASTQLSSRRFMSPFGMTFTLVCEPVACMCEVFGWQTAPTRVLVVF